MTEPRTTASKAEARQLYRTWRNALDAYTRSDTDANQAAEQDTYDRLIDHVEAHGLNYTEHDPRGAAEDPTPKGLPCNCVGGPHGGYTCDGCK